MDGRLFLSELRQTCPRRVLCLLFAIACGALVTWLVIRMEVRPNNDDVFHGVGLNNH